MKQKTHIPIPSETAAMVQFLADRTCCVCNIPGKHIQIHHIDEDPSNNEINNLCLLCLECHNDTMLKGGFGRKLEFNQIKIYRETWNERVKRRRDEADKIASIRSVTGSNNNNKELEFDDTLDYKTNTDQTVLRTYLEKIAIVHKAQFLIAETKWKSGITAEMIQGNTGMIDFYEEVLVELLTFYPKGHFNNLHPKIFINQFISERFSWNRLILEPEGIGFGGTIISLTAAGNVMADLRDAIVQIVKALSFTYDIYETIDIPKWENDWIEEANVRGKT